MVVVMVGEIIIVVMDIVVRIVMIGWYRYLNCVYFIEYLFVLKLILTVFFVCFLFCCYCWILIKGGVCGDFFICIFWLNCLIIKLVRFDFNLIINILRFYFLFNLWVFIKFFNCFVIYNDWL